MRGQGLVKIPSYGALRQTTASSFSGFVAAFACCTAAKLAKTCFDQRNASGEVDDDVCPCCRRNLSFFKATLPWSSLDMTASPGRSK